MTTRATGFCQASDIGPRVLTYDIVADDQPRSTGELIGVARYSGAALGGSGPNEQFATSSCCAGHPDRSVGHEQWPRRAPIAGPLVG